MATKPFAVKGMDVTSPRGKAMWCKFKEPDFKYVVNGALSTSLVCDPNNPTVQAFIAKLDALRDVALAETKETLGAKGNAYVARPVFSSEEDKDGNETGMIIFKFKLNNIKDRVAEGNSSTILVVDAKRNIIPVADQPSVGNGSLIRCVGYANPYSAPNSKEVGISLIWTKMQVIELIEYTAGGGDDFEDEDGFEDPASAKTTEFTDADDF